MSGVCSQDFLTGAKAVQHINMLRSVTETMSITNLQGWCWCICFCRNIRLLAYSSDRCVGGPFLIRGFFQRFPSIACPHLIELLIITFLTEETSFLIYAGLVRNLVNGAEEPDVDGHDSSISVLPTTIIRALL